MIIYNHNIYIMIKIIQILFDTYVYIESYICKYVLSNDDNHNEDNEYTQSVLNKFQRCNWCGNYIDTRHQTIYLYMDKTFCNIKCRNNQIEEDINKN